MKLVKYLFALAICVTASVSHAQTGTPVFTGGGSSALALELGQAAATAPATATPCVWTQKKNANILARDSRVAPPPGLDEQGDIWITWDPGTGSCAAPVGPYNIYSYMNLDSVIGDRCYFLHSTTTGDGCIQIITAAEVGLPDANLLTAGFGTPTPLPMDVQLSLNNTNFNAGGTDIRPEDARFATVRMFTNCGASLTREPYLNTSYQTRGLGYQNTPHVGFPVKSFYSASQFNVVDFTYTGSDPISGGAVRGYTVLTVGAQPMMVAVAPAGGTGLGAATDIQSQNLSLFLNGTYGRSTDVQGPTTTNAVTTLIREPLSGTYNTMEYSNPNSAQFKTSQEQNNCSGITFKQNPLNFASANNVLIGGVHAFRNRVIGTGQMTDQLQAAVTDTLGYFFWSAGNVAHSGNLTNAKYLTVDGVDPIADDYSVTNGVFPTAGGPVLLSAVTFKHLNAGSYPIWSALRVVTTNPPPAGATALIAAAQTLSSTQSDFIPLANLNVWHSHFNMFSIGVLNNSNGPTINPATPGDLCGIPGALPEGGGDAGGATITKQGNHDFCSDFNVTFGIVDKNN